MAQGWIAGSQDIDDPVCVKAEHVLVEMDQVTAVAKMLRMAEVRGGGGGGRRRWSAVCSVLRCRPPSRR